MTGQTNTTPEVPPAPASWPAWPDLPWIRQACDPGAKVMNDARVPKPNRNPEYMCPPPPRKWRGPGRRGRPRKLAVEAPDAYCP